MAGPLGGWRAQRRWAWPVLRMVPPPSTTVRVTVVEILLPATPISAQVRLLLDENYVRSNRVR